MLAVWSPKGGSGTSVVAAALSLVLARRGGCRLVDLAGDQPAVFALPSAPGTGVAEWLAMGADAPAAALDRLAVEASPGLALLPRGGVLPADVAPGAGRRLAEALAAGPRAVADLGTADHPVASEIAAAARPLLAVLRPCYLALRRAADHALADASAGLVVVEEPGRHLSPADVGRVLGRPVVAVVRAEARVARAVDAGSLASRLPDSLARMAARVLAA